MIINLNKKKLNKNLGNMWKIGVRIDIDSMNERAATCTHALTPAHDLSS